jgi:class 3 adenylate cyclase
MSRGWPSTSPPRIMSLADAGEILASRTVRDLVIGSELTFVDSGEHELEGIPDR